jgi:hypothetical protein
MLGVLRMAMNPIFGPSVYGQSHPKNASAGTGGGEPGRGGDGSRTPPKERISAGRESVTLACFKGVGVKLREERERHGLGCTGNFTVYASSGSFK